MKKHYIPNLKVGDKVKIDMEYLKYCVDNFSGKYKKEFQQLINKDGKVVIRAKKTGNTLDIGRGCMQENTQYLIIYGWRIGHGGIPFDKITKIKDEVKPK